jgi:hypothetical protein
MLNPLEIQLIQEQNLNKMIDSYFHGIQTISYNFIIKR